VLIRSSKAHLPVAASCYGRNQLLPDLFRPIGNQLLEDCLQAPILIGFLERQIVLDSDSHGFKDPVEQGRATFCGEPSARNLPGASLGRAAPALGCLSRP
jgi:hypothetical protein